MLDGSRTHSSSTIERVRWDLSTSETEELLKFLENLSQKTWKESEAEVAGGHRRNHDHAVTDLVSSAQKRLRQLNQPEERIYRFRMSGLELAGKSDYGGFVLEICFAFSGTTLNMKFIQ